MKEDMTPMIKILIDWKIDGYQVIVLKEIIIHDNNKIEVVNYE